jgi:hypothetical protein
LRKVSRAKIACPRRGQRIRDIAFQRCNFITDTYQQKACQRPAAEKSELSRLERAKNLFAGLNGMQEACYRFTRAPSDIDSLILNSLACSLLPFWLGITGRVNNN